MEFEVASKSKVVPYPSFYQFKKLSKFWTNMRMIFIIYKFSLVLGK
jgi:hypothetical protein